MTLNIQKTTLLNNRDRISITAIEVYRPIIMLGSSCPTRVSMDKCAVMHFGFANEEMEVRLGDNLTRCWVRRRMKGIWELLCKVT